MSGDPLHAIRTYLDAFNAGDVDAMTGAFCPDGAILDGMAPHLWVGPTAAADWYRDVMAESAHLGASDYHVTLGEPRHHDVSGDHAYVVAPATMTFDLDGKRRTQTGAVFTVALRRLAGNWRVAAWAWAKGNAQT
ncbi:nuclear transport factor 2 family protein [Mycobacterium sp. AMU20-3851]|uniref:YybH family protein n=1 Tax=Mycobacterium sp. AMU20-3851 TaxID=3122055 RepID=UPI0037540DEB